MASKNGENPTFVWSKWASLVLGYGWVLEESWNKLFLVVWGRLDDHSEF